MARQKISSIDFGTAEQSGGFFLLHCWSHAHGSRKYPIYDQHVHRAMTFICKGEREEIENWNDKKKVDAYLTKYLISSIASAITTRRR